MEMSPAVLSLTSQCKLWGKNRCIIVKHNTLGYIWASAEFSFIGLCNKKFLLKCDGCMLYCHWYIAMQSRFVLR